MVETPSRVMYDALKNAGVKMKEAASLLLDPDFKIGGKPLHEKMVERTYLKRYIVDVEPGMIPRNAFRDFQQTAQAIAGRIVKKDALVGMYGETAPASSGLSGSAAGEEGRNGGSAKRGGTASLRAVSAERAIAYLSSEVVDKMGQALEAFGQSPHVYRNMAHSIVSRGDIQVGDRLVLLVLLLVSAGCTGSSVEASEAVEKFSMEVLTSGFHTAVLDEDEIPSPEMLISLPEDEGEAEREVWLFRRLSNNRTNPKPYLLSPAPGGTVIGRHPSTTPCIDDVDNLVSANHLRIWRNNEGEWFAEGMGSTNGSELISNVDGSVVVIEPPASERAGWSSTPVRIFPGDTIRLAGSVEFLVVS